MLHALFFVVILMLLTYKSFVTDLILVFYICYLLCISFFCTLKLLTSYSSFV